MGNLCSSSSDKSDPFAQPGRRLGDAPVTPASASVPSSAAPKKAPTVVGGPPRRLGGDNPAPSAGGGDSPDEARRKAALAAEARAKNTKGGDLSKKLADQKKLTQRAQLEEAARQNLREREVDNVAETLRNN